MPAVSEEKTAAVQEYEDKIDKLESTINAQNKREMTMRKQIESIRRQLKERWKTVKTTKEEVQNMLTDMKKNQAAAMERQDKLKGQLASAKKELQELETRNMELENLLQNNKLEVVAVKSPRNESSFGFGESKRIISGTLSKFGKGGRKRPKSKYVIFVTVGKSNYVEWSDEIGSD